MSDPFLIDSPTCISFSGGRTSAYLLWRVLESNGGMPIDARACFANTGKESPETLQFVADCAANWGVHIDWLEYRPEGVTSVDFDAASRNGEPFAALIAKKSYLPNPIARFCTADLKVNPINKYLAAQGWEDFDTMVGVRADEPRRVAKMRGRLLTPLADAGVTQGDVQAFWKKQPFNLGLTFRDGVTAMGNCDLCFLKGGHQIASLIAQDPNRAVWWAAQEQAVGATFRSDRPSYTAMAKFAASQSDMFDPAEEAIACFCGD